MQVTIGEEGFFGPNDPNVNCNPGEPNAGWAASSGQDFTNNHRSKDIDFTVCPSPFPCPAAPDQQCKVLRLPSTHQQFLSYAVLRSIA